MAQVFISAIELNFELMQSEDKHSGIAINAAELKEAVKEDNLQEYFWERELSF